MSYYGNDSWNASGRQASWEQPQPPSRSATASAGGREEPNAFASQIAEVDRAIDNLMKSGKFPQLGGFPGPRAGAPAASGGPRPFVDFDPRMGPGPRHHPSADFEGGRTQPGSNLQNFYQNQRYGGHGGHGGHGGNGGRSGEQDQGMAARRRIAAQRERELRNYHQEQQYHKHLSGPKSDRSMSPNTGMTEDERRDLIARQHRALYGESSSLYTEPATSRPASGDARVTTAIGGHRGNSPLTFGMQSQSSDSAVQMPSRDHSKDAPPRTQRSRANSNSSPSSNQNINFGLFDNAQQSSRTSNSSPTGGSPPRNGAQQQTSGGVAPIGTRPSQGQQQGSAALQKRSTTPLPSPLSFGFSASDNNANERSTSASSNPSSNVENKGVGLGWGSNSGVWGSGKGSLGVQASVWG